MHLQTHHFSHCILLSVLLGFAVDVTSGSSGIQLIPQYPVINGSVTLSVTGITGTIESIVWYKGPTTDSPYQILTYFPGTSSPLVKGHLFNASFLAFSNGSLQIKDLRITDAGRYTVKIQTDIKGQDIPVTLTVYELVTKPSITASITQPKENDTFILTCNTEKATTITWKRHRTHISSEATLSGGNKTLTFPSIKREDSGEYQCEAQNLVSKKSSDPYTVTVAYGPIKPRIQGELLVGVGSPITLLCSADSFPNPTYQWKFNEKLLEQSTNKYEISNATMENRGLYTCMMKNSITGLTVIASEYVNVTTEVLSKKDFAIPIGIAVAIVLLLILIAATVYLFIIHKRRKTAGQTNSTVKASSRNGQADIPTQTTDHELQYAAIEFSNNTPGKQEKPEIIYENRSPQEQPQSDNVLYSELKLR